MLPCCLFSLAAAPALAATPVVTGFSPSQADNCGMLVGATVSGSNFLPGATVTLTRTGDPDIPGVNVDVQSSTTIVADFDLSGIPSGMRKVVVTNPDPDGSGTLSQALQVTWCPPVLTSCSLTHTFTCGVRQARLDGTNLAYATGQHTMKLTKAGELDIPGTFDGGLPWLGCWDPVTGAVNCAIAYFDIAEGTAGGLWSVVWTREDGQTATLVDAVEVIAECPRGRVGDLYVCNLMLNNVLQFDGLTGDFVCIFAGAQQYGEATELVRPRHLAWAPDGNLLVTSTPVGCSGGVVLECDGNTGEFLGYVVPPPCDQNRFQTCLTFGGPNGDLYIQTSVDSDDVIAQQYEPAPPWTFIQDSLRTAPPMIKSYGAAFAANGNLLVLGSTVGLPVPTFREYQFNSGTGEFELLREVVDVGDKKSVVESPDACCYLVTEANAHRVDRYSIGTFEYLDTLVPPSPCLFTPGDPCFFEAMRYPFDLAYGPDGRLFVSGRETAVPDPTPGPGYALLGAIHAFDPATGQQLDFFGQQGDGDLSIPPDPEKLWAPYGLGFKPMPGDYTSAGGAFAGDWTVNLADLAKFAENMLGPGLRPTNPHALLSFDQDRDGDLDLKDYAAFQRAFGTSMQTNVGACCLPDGTCLDDVWQPECSGFFLGDGTTCGAGCPPFGACCNSDADGTCQDLTEDQCLAQGDIYQGDYTECATTDCPYGRYSNEIDPMTSAAVAGAGLQIADDMTLEGAGARDLVFLDLRVYGNGGGAFDVTVELWTDCPSDGGSVIPNTTFDWLAVPDDGYVYILQVDPLSPAVTIPDTVWMTASFTTPESGWIIAEQAETGATDDLYGRDNPWNCNATFTSNYAGLWANLRCVEGSSRAAGSAGGDSTGPQLRIIKVDSDVPPLAIEPVE